MEIKADSIDLKKLSPETVIFLKIKDLRLRLNEINQILFSLSSKLPEGISIQVLDKDDEISCNPEQNSAEWEERNKVINQLIEKINNENENSTDSY